MKIGLLTLILAVLLGLTTRAEASRHYYLVGLRHVYRFEMFPDPREPERQQIEEDYAAAIKQAQDQYDTDMRSIANEEYDDGGRVHQNDRDAVQMNIEESTARAADTRDERFSQIYIQCDYVRDRHPELVLDQDGPYRVMCVDTRPSGEFTRVVFYRPYPLYMGPCPYGWEYGHSYTYVSYGYVVRRHHEEWISCGSPLFASIYIGGLRIEFFAPVRREVIVDRRIWVGGRPPRFTEREREHFDRQRQVQIQHGIFRERVYRAERGGERQGIRRDDRTGTPPNGGSHYIRTDNRKGDGATGGSRYPGDSGTRNNGVTNDGRGANSTRGRDGSGGVTNGGQGSNSSRNRDGGSGIVTGGQGSTGSRYRRGGDTGNGTQTTNGGSISRGNGNRGDSNGSGTGRGTSTGGWTNDRNRGDSNNSTTGRGTSTGGSTIDRGRGDSSGSSRGGSTSGTGNGVFRSNNGGNGGNRGDGGYRNGGNNRSGGSSTQGTSGRTNSGGSSNSGSTRGDNKDKKRGPG